MFDHLADLPAMFDPIDASHLDWYPHVDIKDATGHTIEHATTGPDGGTQVTDPHGNWIGHSTLDHNGLTFYDSHGNATGYDYPFGGIDHLLDSNHQAISSLDTLGAIHNSQGGVVGHVESTSTLFGSGPTMYDAHNELIASIDRWFDQSR